MEKVQINKLVRLIPGINPTRKQNQYEKNINYYDQVSFEIDCSYEDIFYKNKENRAQQNNLFLNEGDIVISHALQQATIVGKKNIGKVLSLNFIKVEFESENLDKRYFLFLFNVYKDVKRQKERALQGSGSVLRIPIHALEEIVIPIVPVSDQIKIGAIYVETLKLQNKLNKYGELIEQFTNSMIEENLKEK